MRRSRAHRIAALGTACITAFATLANLPAQAEQLPGTMSHAPSTRVSSGAGPTTQTTQRATGATRTTKVKRPGLKIDVRGAPADPTPTQVTQPDGSRITVRRHGDAARNWLTTDGNATVVKGADGFYRFAKGLDANGQPVAGAVKAGARRTPPGSARGVAPTKDKNPAQVQQLPSLGFEGAQKTLVILAQFTDQASLGSTASQWSSSFFGMTGSVNSFYKGASRNRMSLTAAAETSGTANDGVIGWVTVPMAHPNSGDKTGDLNRKLAAEAIKAADPYINYATYDSNGNGAIEPAELHVVVIAAGYEASYSGACGPNVWGHHWNTYSYTPSVDGKQVGSAGYMEFGEMHCTKSNPGSTHVATIGIMAHEFGHDLGWPDLYDVSKSDQGIGEWSLMASGSWGAYSGYSGSSPTLPDAYSKYLQGWINPREITGPTSVTITAASIGDDDVRLLPDPDGAGVGSQGEFFLLENRQQSGLDIGLPGCGIVIYHVKESFGDNVLTANGRLIDVEEADGEAGLSAIPGYRGGPGDAWHGVEGHTTFNTTSIPNTRLYGTNAVSGVSVTQTGDCATTMTVFAWADANGKSTPRNDNFAYAYDLGAAVSGKTDQQTNYATKQAGEPNHASSAGGASVWFKWTAPDTGKLSVTTAGSNFITMLGLYNGGGLDSLNWVAQNNGLLSPPLYQAALTDVDVVQGTTYYLAVDGYSGQTGILQLAWSLVGHRPPNDNIIDATLLSPTASGILTQSTAYASKQVGEWNQPADATGGASVWFRWTAPTSGILTLTTAGSTYDTLLEVYDGGPAFPDLNYRASNDDENTSVSTSRINGMPVIAGTTYRIVVDGYLASTGQLRLGWAFTPTSAPANDNFVSARVLSPAASGAIVQWIGKATAEAGEPAHGGRPAGRSVWFQWTAPATGKVTISTAGSDYDTTMGLYTGSTVSALTQVAGNDDENYPFISTSRIAAQPVRGGTTYRIAVDGYDGAIGSLRLTWSFRADPAFVPLTPSRILDTRSGIGAPLGTVLAGRQVDLQVTGRGGVPAGATTVVLNVTAVTPAGWGYVTVWPTGSVKPTASNLNYVAGQTVPNLVIAKVGTGGKVSLAVAGTTHLIADVAGYYPTGAKYTGLTPVRLLDTRVPIGAPKVRIPAGGTVTVGVAGTNGVPTSASAAVVNITPVGPSTAGTITAYPTGVAVPAATSVSFRAGQTIAGLAIVKLGTGGKITLRSTAQTDLIVDLGGWLPAGADGVAFTPARIQAATPVASAGSLTVRVAGVGGVPVNAKAVQVTITAVNPSRAGYLTAFPTGSTRPVVSNVNYAVGGSISNSAIVKVGANGSITIYSSDPTSVQVDASAFWLP